MPDYDLFGFTVPEKRLIYYQVTYVAVCGKTIVARYSPKCHEEAKRCAKEHKGVLKEIYHG